MILPNQKIVNWLALLIISLAGLCVSLYGYWQITSIPVLTTIAVTRPYPKTIFIDSPKANKTIGNPVTISGRAKTSEGILAIRIKDADENILQRSTIETMRGEKLFPFSLTIPYQKPMTKTGIIELFEYIDKDNTETGQTAIPVLFSN